MKRLLFLLAAIIIGGCGTGVPNIDGTDWCYRFDFRLDDNGFNIQNGSWLNGLGLLTDADGLLIFNYGHDAYVQPSYAIVIAQRVEGIAGDVDISATGDIFGISATFTATLPANMSSYPAVFQPQELGIAGNAINVTIQTSQYLLISLIEIRGMGTNPFPVNMCPPDNLALTPGTDTPTPVYTYTPTTTGTATLTRTPTPTPPESPTPSPTPELWECFIDGDFAGWSFPPFQGAVSTVSGGDIVGAASTEVDATFLNAVMTVGGNVTEVEVAYSYDTPAPPTPPLYQEMRLYINGETVAVDGLNFASDTAVLVWTGSVTGSNEFNILSGVFGRGAGIDLRVTNVHISGTGSTPLEDGTGISCDNFDTPTPTPTLTSTPAPHTLTPSRTPVGFWTCTFNFANNAANWVSVYNAQWGFSVDNVGAWRAKTVTPKNSMGIRFNAAGTMPLRTIRIKGRTYGTRLDDEDELNFRFYNGSSWTNFTQSSYNNTAFDQIYTLSQNATRIEIYLTISQTTVDPVEIYLVTLQGQGGTDPCSTATPTVTATGSTPTRTPQAGSTGTLTPKPLVTGTQVRATRTAIVIPTFGQITIPPGTPGTSTPGPGTPGTGTPPTSTTGTPSTALPAGEIGDETGEIIGFSWEIGWGLFRTLFAWVGQVTDDITSLLTAFFNTPPQAIPGMPQCMTRPLEHDWCAIIYIIEWTILAPDTPGVLIVPSIMILMNFYIFIKFVSWVLRLIRKGQSVTDVQ